MEVAFEIFGNDWGEAAADGRGLLAAPQNGVPAALGPWELCPSLVSRRKPSPLPRPPSPGQTGGCEGEGREVGVGR